MYRPEGYKNPYGVYPDEIALHSIFEAGADAIINALKAEGVYTYGNHTPDIDLRDAKEDSGYWVFLPDEGYSYGEP